MIDRIKEAERIKNFEKERRMKLRLEQINNEKKLQKKANKLLHQNGVKVNLFKINF